MKKILIVIPSLKHGGTNRSLLNFYNTFKETYNINILPLDRTGYYALEFPKEKIINLFILNSYFFGINNKNKFIYLRFYIKFILKIFEAFLRINTKNIIYRFYSKHIVKKNYSAVLAFQEGITTEFVSMINHKNKICWIRCDYKEYLKIVLKNEFNVYQKFHQIFCVSKYTKKNFLEIYPKLLNKTEALYNIIDYQDILIKSKEYNISFNKFTIVSIGRIDKVKQFSKIPLIAKKLVDNNFTFQWLIIGDRVDNNEYTTLISNIKKYSLEKYVIIKGEINNPYPYILNSNLLVSTSLSEACPNVVIEAQILKIPIIANDFGSVNEFITQDINGIIVPINNMHNAIINYIKDKKLRSFLKQNTFFNEEINNKSINLLMSKL